MAKDPLRAFDPARWAAFPSTNRYGIPTVRGTSLVPDHLVPYHTRDRVPATGTSALHFFTDDHLFEHVWWSPEKTLERVTGAAAVCTPDFSQYHHYPLAGRIWNVYRKCWLGCYWEAHGLTVIPTVTWAGPESWDFAFRGVQRGSVVVAGTIGLEQDSFYWNIWRSGYLEMLRQIDPAVVLIYGENPRVPTRHGVETRRYPTATETLRATRKARSGEEVV